MNFELMTSHDEYVHYAVIYILMAMSAVSWSIIIFKVYNLIRIKNKHNKIKLLMTESTDLLNFLAKIKNISAPMSEIARKAYAANLVYKQEHNTTLATQIPFDQYIMQDIRNLTDKYVNSIDSGLSLLASIGSVSPFIGLFGTVIGIYHTLINISAEGQVTLSEVSGPIGEALIATAAGLVVAIPALMGYNFFVRQNKKLTRNIISFSHTLYQQLVHLK